jgi:rubrerythrin
MPEQDSAAPAKRRNADHFKRINGSCKLAKLSDKGCKPISCPKCGLSHKLKKCPWCGYEKEKK